MIKLFKKSLLPFGGTLLLASASFAQVEEYVNDSFDEWVDYGNANPGLWELTNIGSNDEHEWEFRTEDPDGTPNNSIWTRGYLFRTVYTSDWYQLSDYQIIPTNEEPVVFSYRFYDLMDREEGVASQLRNFTELGDVTVEGDTATANALFAFGVWDGSNTHYQIRNYPADNWVMTDVERTVGWHEVKWVFLKNTFNLFFDDEPVFISRPYRGMSKGFTRISLASGYANRFESMIYDDVYLAQGADFAPDMFIDKQPADDFFSTGAVSEFGGTASFSVETTGGIEPFTYQWYHDGELLVNDDRISGADTDTLIIEGTKGSDSGEYYVTVSDSGANFVQSSVVKLLALVEHEGIYAGIDLPAEAVIGTWNGPGGGWHGSDRFATMTEDPDAERTVTFDLDITDTGWYEIWTYFIPSYAGEGNNRTTEAPFFVHHADGEDLVLVNQQHTVGGAAGARWVHVGDYKFEEGGDNKVVISNVYQQEKTDTRYGSLVFAGAMRWIPTEAPDVDGDGPAVAIARTEAGEIELLISGEPDASYTIESVDNLGDEWAVIGSETADSDGNAVFTDSTADESSRRFYRVVIE